MNLSIERESAKELELNKDEVASMCSLMVDKQVFGIEASKVREVLGRCWIQKVPLAPAFIAGVITNRGEVLTTVDLRSLLGLEPRTGARTVLVLEDDDEGEWFGLVVDLAGGMVPVRAETLESNPSTLGARSKALFDGAYKLPTGLMIRLNVGTLRPALLGEGRLFRN
jgi:purine-binding chemotaxis protein CheW